jgi:hypothetical protein
MEYNTRHRQFKKLISVDLPNILLWKEVLKDVSVD